MAVGGIREHLGFDWQTPIDSERDGVGADPIPLGPCACPLWSWSAACDVSLQIAVIATPGPGL